MNCKDCKFWNKHNTECNKIDWLETSKPLTGNDFALDADFLDDQGLQLHLKTGPLFGCIQFVKR